MQTSQKQTSLFTGGTSTSSPEVFLVNPTPQQGSDLEQKMLATSGRKCLEQFGRFNRATLWARMFAASLIGMEGWYLTRCRLIWKMKATKLSRFYFQLAPSTLPTEGTEFGLLPTVLIKNNENRQSEGYGPNLGTALGLLPTPTVNDMKNASLPPSQVNRNDSIVKRILNNDSQLLLPTPATRDYKGARTTESLEEAGRNHTNSLPDAFGQPGKSSQLNPRFVAEMMGFPPDYLELPFLNTETKA